MTTTKTTPSLMRMAARGLGRPRLLAAMFTAAWRFRRRRWWSRPPFLPLPTRAYLDWRLHTAYGDTGAGPDGAEMERYLRWANRMHRTRRTVSGAP